MTQRARPRRERRRHPRALTDLRATVTIDGHSHAAKVINLSMGGALLDLGAGPLTSSVVAGHPITVEIRCQSRESTLHADARAVLWHDPAGPMPLLAVQFEPLADEATERLSELMDEALWELRARFLAAAASDPSSLDDATAALETDA
jgi:hypothetical protein